MYSVSYRDPRDKANLIEDTLTKVLTRAISAVLSVSGNQGLTDALLEVLATQNEFNDRMIMEDLNRRPEIRYRN